MKKIVKEYKKGRAHRPLFKIDLSLGIILLIYTFIYVCTPFVENVWIYLIMFAIIYVALKLVKYWFMLYFVYGLKEKLNWGNLSFSNIKCLYEKKVDNINRITIEKMLEDMSIEQIDIFYNYLCDTKNSIEFLKIKDILIMGFSFAIGASFDNNAIISTKLFSNAVMSIIGCFLGLAPFYIIFIEIYMARNKLENDNITKNEMISYINEIRYNKLIEN